MKRVFVCIAVALTLVGCAGGKVRLTGGGATPVPELPAPSATPAVISARPYKIGPFDRLTYNVYGIEELQGEVQADSAGNISIPLLGPVAAAGKTPAELADLITVGLRGRYVRNPQVAVNVKEAVSHVLTVDGQVREPGLYPVLGDMTLIRAVASAKGLSEYASQEDVVVFRTVDGQRYAALYNLKAIRQGAYHDPELYPDDVIVVGESSARRLFRDLLQAAPAVLTPITILLTRNNN